MRETFRAEVRQIAGAIAFETVMRHGDALARSPHAERLIEAIARRTAAEIAHEIADERAARAEQVLAAAREAAGETAAATAREIAGAAATAAASEAAAASLAEVRAAVEEDVRAARAAAESDRKNAWAALRDAREGAKRDLRAGRDSLDEARSAVEEEVKAARSAVEEELKGARASLARTREEMTRHIDRFAREEAARVVAEVVAGNVPPVVEVNVEGALAPVRVGGHTHRLLPDVLLALGAGCHVLLVGPAGTGKSMMAQQAAEAFEQEFHALSLGPTTPMSKIFGYYDAHGHYHGTPFRRAFEHGGLMLLDELDSGHPGLLAELNQALSIRSCAFADGMVEAHPDFRLVATANTYGTGGDRQYVGRQALDAATLDRYIVIDVPVDEGLEERLALGFAPSRQDEAMRVVKEVRRLRATAAEKRLPVMFSPRASIDAARLLQAGASVEQAMRWRVVRGMSAAHRSALGLAEDGAA
ncbi:AAA family ATPase [Actinomadura litoris]|uniref:AAA family ATPase n=1 Tax=Actinomadura litoris TaxID=2678616 RepID=UPI001FA7D0B3|nr:AAA family ATPase [Actinomadura litoris]